MGLFHRHHWREVGRAFTGRYTFEKISGIGADDAQKLMVGLTVLEMRCDGCGDRKSVELLGHHVQQGSPDV